MRRLTRLRLELATAALLSLVLVSRGWGQETPKLEAVETSDGAPRSAHQETIAPAFARTAFGASAGVVGASAYLQSRGSWGQGASATSGGFRFWGAPFARLTLFGEGGPHDEGTQRRFAPSVGAAVRVAGSWREGAALAVMARYKAEGFAELGGEAELGLLASWRRGRLHGDVNAIAGAAFEEREGDAELVTGAGVDLSSFVSAGLEARARRRVAGDVRLPGGRLWDALGGALLSAGWQSWIGVFMVGPTNAGLGGELGWFVLASLGAVSV